MTASQSAPRRAASGTSERQRLLVAMTELCAKQGYIETSVDQVIAQAGVSAAHFDQLFGSKEECLLAAVNEIMGETVRVVASSISVDRSEWDSALYGVKAILELMAARPASAHLGYIGARQMGPDRARGIYVAGVRMLAVLIERLWEYSESQVQPARAAVAVMGGAEALIRREIVAGRVDELPRLLPDITYAATVPFLGQEEAMRLFRRAQEVLRSGAAQAPGS